MQFKATKEIVQDGPPSGEAERFILRTKAKPLAHKDIGSPELAKLIEKMRALLAREKNGVGLAAPQVGVPVALFIVAGRVFDEEREQTTNDEQQTTKAGKTVKPEPHPLDKVFINPELIRQSRKKKEMNEGCLSVRGIYGTVMRHEKASIKAVDENGKPVMMNGSGLLAHIFQHEMDHLNGVLFIDKAVSLDTKIKDKK